MTWKQNGIRHDTKHDKIRLSKGKSHKDGHEFSLCEYQTPPEAEIADIQQVRAVWDGHKNRWELHVVCEKELSAESPGDKTAGVDLGICTPAAVAFPDDALLYPGDTLREDKQYFQREEYQTEEPHGPSQTAQWARKKLSRRKDSCTLCRKTSLNGVLLTTEAHSLSVTQAVSMRVTGGDMGTNAWIIRRPSE